MSNLLNSFYSNLNDLISINATDVTSEIINCNSLYVSGVRVDGSGVDLTSIQNQINTINTSLNGLLNNFALAGVYVDTTTQALFIALYDLRVQKTLYLYDANNNPYYIIVL